MAKHRLLMPVLEPVKAGNSLRVSSHTDQDKVVSRQEGTLGTLRIYHFFQMDVQDAVMMAINEVTTNANMSSVF